MNNNIIKYNSNKFNLINNNIASYNEKYILKI